MDNLICNSLIQSIQTQVCLSIANSGLIPQFQGISWGAVSDVLLASRIVLFLWLLLYWIKSGFFFPSLPYKLALPYR